MSLIIIDIFWKEIQLAGACHHCKQNYHKYPSFQADFKSYRAGSMLKPDLVI